MNLGLVLDFIKYSIVVLIFWPTQRNSGDSAARMKQDGRLAGCWHCIATVVLAKGPVSIRHG